MTRAKIRVGFPGNKTRDQVQCGEPSEEAVDRPRQIEHPETASIYESSDIPGNPKPVKNGFLRKVNGAEICRVLSHAVVAQLPWKGQKQMNQVAQEWTERRISRPHGLYSRPARLLVKGTAI